MNTADSNSAGFSMPRNSPSLFTEPNNFEDIMWGLGHDNWDPSSQTTSDAHERDAPEYLWGQATLTRPARATLDTPPQTDNEFKDCDSSDDVDPNYSDESSTHTPVQTTSANTASQRPGASIPSQDCTAPTGPRHTRSTLRTRDAPSEPTVSTTPEIPTTPRALSAMSRGSEAIAQMALAHPNFDQTKAGSMTSNGHTDPDLLGPTTTSPQGSKTTIETSFGGRESTQQVLLDGNRVQANETMDSQPESSINRYQPSTRGSSRPLRPESSKDNTEVEGGNQPARSRPSNTARPRTQHGRNSSYAGSVYSASSSKSRKCVLENTELANNLLELIDGLVNDNKDHIGLLEINVKDIIISFYDEHACGQAEGPEEDIILSKISNYGVAKSALIVNWVDKAYVGAGWHLRHRILEERRASSPILDAHSPPSLPRPNVRNSPNRPPPAKRRTKSQSGTSPSGKRSRQNSTQQSINSATPESRTSVSQSETPKEFHCHLCGDVSQELRKWKRHYDTHLPRFYWGCVFDDCPFVANVPNGIVQHCAGKQHRVNIRSNPVLKQKLKRNKFVIPDGGHERCIYCREEISGKDSSLSRSHIADHFKDMTAEARHQAYNHCCSDPRCGKKDGEDGKRAYWKSNPFVLRENRIRATADDGTEATGRGNGSEGDDGNDSTRTFEGEDEQGPGGSVSRGNGWLGGMGGANGGGMGGSSWGGNGGGMGGRNSGGWRGEGRGMGGGRGRSRRGENGSGNGGGNRGGYMAATTRHSSPIWQASAASIPSTDHLYMAATTRHSIPIYRAAGPSTRSSDHRSTTLRSPRGSSSADFEYPINSYLDRPDYAVGGHFTPSKSNVVAHMGQMQSQLDVISEPLEHGTG